MELLEPSPAAADALRMGELLPWTSEWTVGLTGASSCGGVLVVHRDGSRAACSEELDGRCCEGPDAPHLRRISCADLLGVGGCEVCAVDEDQLLRHAVRLAVAVRRAPCRRHRPARQRRPDRPG